MVSVGNGLDRSARPQQNMRMLYTNRFIINCVCTMRNGQDRSLQSIQLQKVHAYRYESVYHYQLRLNYAERLGNVRSG